MSVLIKGMVMPSVCAECWLFHEGYCGATIDGRECDVDVFNAKTDWCPLGDVPTPHGKLIDADMLEDQCGDWYIEQGTEEGFLGPLGMLLDEVPTVIEAEE